MYGRKGPVIAVEMSSWCGMQPTAAKLGWATCWAEKVDRAAAQDTMQAYLVQCNCTAGNCTG